MKKTGTILLLLFVLIAVQVAASVGKSDEKHPSNNVNQVDERGYTKLWWAVKRNDPKEVKRLLKAGANPNPSTEWKYSPLSQLGYNCSKDMEDGANNCLDILEQLMDAGVDVNLRNRDDWGGEASLPHLLMLNVCHYEEAEPDEFYVAKLVKLIEASHFKQSLRDDQMYRSMNDDFIAIFAEDGIYYQKQCLKQFRDILTLSEEGDK